MYRLMALCLICLLLVVPIAAQDDDPYTVALQRITEAHDSAATKLNLQGLYLMDVPPEIGQLRHLEALYLDFNYLTSLPPEIAQLSNLQSLSIIDNQLTSFPLVIGQLDNLQQLDLGFNQLTSLPSEIGLLTQLRALLLDGNQLTSLPPEIGQLTQLQGLYVTHNELTHLPSEVGQLSHLCRLELQGNNLRQLPTTLGNLNAEILAPGNSCYYPDTFAGIDVTDNPLISPPPEVVEQGAIAMIAYLRQQAWYHMQRIIVGVAGSIGLCAMLVLGLRWKQRGGRKPKQKRG